jgi:hypothetical protein
MASSAVDRDIFWPWPWCCMTLARLLRLDAYERRSSLVEDSGGFVAGAEGCCGVEEVGSSTTPIVCSAESCLRPFDGGGGSTTGPRWRVSEGCLCEGVLQIANDKDRSALWPQAMLLSMSWLRVRGVGSEVQSQVDALN